MSNHTVSGVTIQLRRDTAANWTAKNPVLAAGEIGIETNTLKAKVGDGATAWRGLSYAFGITNYVTTDTAQNITGTKTFVGTKKIEFKQSANSDKLGFTLFMANGTERGYLEFNPTNTIDGVAGLMTLGNYATAAGSITHVGFRRYSNISGASGAYNLLMPLIADAKAPFNLTTTYTNFYLLLGVKEGNSMLKVGKSGVLDVGPLFPAGMVEAYAGSTIPDGYLLCDGSAVSRTTYSRLFAAIGTTHGAGDGSTTFNVPDIPQLATNVRYIIKV